MRNIYELYRVQGLEVQIQRFRVQGVSVSFQVSIYQAGYAGPHGGIPFKGVCASFQLGLVFCAVCTGSELRFLC